MLLFQHEICWETKAELLRVVGHKDWGWVCGWGALKCLPSRQEGERERLKRLAQVINDCKVQTVVRCRFCTLLCIVFAFYRDRRILSQKCDHFLSGLSTVLFNLNVMSAETLEAHLTYLSTVPLHYNIGCILLTK